MVLDIAMELVSSRAFSPFPDKILKGNSLKKDGETDIPPSI